MNETLKRAMLEATRLTQAGRIAEATALIQRALGGDDTEIAAEGRQDVTDRERGAWPSAASTPGHPVEPPTSGLTLEHEPGGSTVSGRVSCPAGSRDYKLFVPSERSNGSIPLLVMLHGCGQDPDEFAAVTRMSQLAAAEEFAVLYPAQSPSANASGCWAWYSPDNQRRDKGEPAILAAMTRQVCDAVPVDQRRVFVAGFSAGGAMAATMAATYPDLFAAVGAHSGLPYASARDMVSAMAVMAQGVGNLDRLQRPAASMPIIVFQGEADMTVNPRNAPELVAQFLSDSREGSLGSASAHLMRREHLTSRGGLEAVRTCYLTDSGATEAELWAVQGAGHGWLGGSPEGRFTEPHGPDASREMLRFFLSLS